MFGISDMDHNTLVSPDMVSMLLYTTWGSPMFGIGDMDHNTLVLPDMVSMLLYTTWGSPMFGIGDMDHNTLVSPDRSVWYTTLHILQYTTLHGGHLCLVSVTWTSTPLSCQTC